MSCVASVTLCSLMIVANRSVIFVVGAAAATLAPRIPKELMVVNYRYLLIALTRKTRKFETNSCNLFYPTFAVGMHMRCLGKGALRRVYVRVA